MLKTKVIEREAVLPEVIRPVARPAPRRVRPVAIKVTEVVVTDVPTDPVMEHTVLERLLTMAQRYRSTGEINAAMEMFWELAEDHADSSEGKTARQALLEIAAFDEREGAKHMARAIYERLLDDAEE
jgi:hypothetical protein